MAQKIPNQLSERHQLLLSSYLDGQCGRLTRLRAQYLLKRSSSARDFADSMKRVHLAMLARHEGRVRQSSEGKPVDLWDRISRRIDQEEYAAQFLGERRSSGSVAAQPFSMSWGMAGALVAASLVLVFFPVGRLMQSGQTRMVSERSSSHPPLGDMLPSMPALSVSASSGGAAPVSPRFVSGRQMRSNYAQPVEVDWIRSHGRVRLIQDPGRRSHIIWVKRHPRRKQVLINGTGAAGSAEAALVAEAERR